MDRKTIRDISLKNKRVLVRVDYNVSLFDGFRIGDDLRIKQTLPTLHYLLDRGCTLFLAAHLGRPKGKIQKKLSLKPVQKHLETLLGKPVGFIVDYINGEASKAVDSVKPNSVHLLENLRFHKGEKANDPRFAKRLASYGEVFVNDAFGVCHRKHASVVGVAELLPAVAGFLLEKEVDIIDQAVEDPKRPFVVIIGGAKTETKIPVIKRLLKKADTVLLGGGVANTFLRASGFKMGQSLYDRNLVAEAKKLLIAAACHNTKIMLPLDGLVGNLKKDSYEGVMAVNKIPAELQALDIGPKTEVAYGAEIARAETIIWNGPMGVFEKKQFALGTEFIYQAIAENRNCLSIVGGGETIVALPKEEYLETIDHVSTGGGAMLEFIEKGTLPGLEVLQKNT